MHRDARLYLRRLCFVHAHVADELGQEQKRVVDLVLKGKSVFVTGAAGTGKSYLIKKLHQVRH
ncbi:unnamed protein product, partial [Hapterophycus canaliculatus]